MTLDLHTDAPPLRQDSTGAVRVGGSRVLLELVIDAFHDGATPEAIVQSYPTLTLPDVYAVIAYYLRHAEAIDQYMADRHRQAVAVRKQLEGRQDGLAAIRARLLARRNA